MRSYPPFGVSEKATISLSNESQELVDLNTGVDREGRALESLETGLLSLQNWGKHYSHETGLLQSRYSKGSGTL
jgi:hypothetical protein